jgi:hypothetical protein
MPPSGGFTEAGGIGFGASGELAINSIQLKDAITTTKVSFHVQKPYSLFV